MQKTLEKSREQMLKEKDKRGISWSNIAPFSHILSKQEFLIKSNMLLFSNNDTLNSSYKESEKV